MKKKNKKCINCLSERFDITAKGLCKRCYILERKIEIINRWNFDNPKTLKHYPRNGIFNNKEAFEKIKNGFSKQLKERLVELKYKEEKLNSNITGLDLEYKIRNISKLTGSKAEFFGYADIFDHRFNNKQKKILFDFFNKITENIKWKGIDWYKLWNSK